MQLVNIVSQLARLVVLRFFHFLYSYTIFASFLCPLFSVQSRVSDFILTLLKTKCKFPSQKTVIHIAIASVHFVFCYFGLVRLLASTPPILKFLYAYGESPYALPCSRLFPFAYRLTAVRNFATEICKKKGTFEGFLWNLFQFPRVLVKVVSKVSMNIKSYYGFLCLSFFRFIIYIYIKHIRFK